MGEPEYLSPAALAELHTASHLRDDVEAYRFQDAAVEFDITVPPLGVAAVTLQCAARQSDWIARPVG